MCGFRSVKKLYLSRGGSCEFLHSFFAGFHPKKERCDARKGSKHPGVPWDRMLLCRTKGSMIMIMDGP